MKISKPKRAVLRLISETKKFESEIGIDIDMALSLNNGDAIYIFADKMGKMPDELKEFNEAEFIVSRKWIDILEGTLLVTCKDYYDT